MQMTPLRLRLLVAALLSVSFLGALDHTVVSTSLATIAGSFSALEHMSWVVVGYTLASTVMLPILGKIGDIVGPRRVFLSSLAVFLLASLACGFAQNIETLIVARIAQGMSSAGIQLLSQTIIAFATTPRERPKYLGIIGAAFPVAILVGPVLGGLITDHWGWPWVFWINLPVGALAFALSLVAVPHIEPGGVRSFDILGAMVFTVALTGLVLAVTWAPDAGSSGAALICGILAAVLFVVFFVIELRVAHPMVPIRAFTDRSVACGIALSAIIGIGLFSLTAYLPTYIQMAYRTSATVSGLVPIATVFGMLISNLTTGALASRNGKYWIYPVVGTVVGAMGLVAMALLPVGVPLWVPMVIMAIVGLGTGSFMNLIVAVVQSAVPRSETGSITATTNLARQVGSTLATALIGAVLGYGVASRLPSGLNASNLTPQQVQAAAEATQFLVAEIYRDVFVPIFLALAAVYVVGVVAALLLPNKRLSDHVEPDRPLEAQTV